MPDGICTNAGTNTQDPSIAKPAVRAVRMTNVRTGGLIATLEQSGVHLDIAARRPAPLPPELRERAMRMVVGEKPGK